MNPRKRTLLPVIIYLAIGAAVAMVLRDSVDVARAQVGTQTGNANSEREAAWNSPEMLRARAWLNDYCKGGNGLSEEEAAAHLQALETMTPQQMKLFAMTHDAVSKSHPAVQASVVHQQALEQAKQAAAAQQWWYQNVHKAETQRALQADAATQQAYSNINQEESAAANEEEAQLQSEQAFARENQASKLDELNNPYPYGYGYPYGYPGTQFHFHLYPDP